jgi:hypothetical protein
MSFEGTERRRSRGLTFWLAGAAALVALALLVWAALGARGDGSREATETRGPGRRATVNAAEAVALAPEFDPGPAGAPGGPGTAVLDGPALPTATPRSTGAQARRPTRRAREARPRDDDAPSRPSYRAIGPGADDAPAEPPNPSGA